MSQVISSAAILLMVASCVVKSTQPYYLPSAINGINARAIEPNTNSVILFKQQDVIIGVNTNYYSSIQDGHHINNLYVRISFEVPEGKVVQLVQHHVEVSALSKTWKSELSGTIWTGMGRIGEFPKDAKMIGKNKAVRFGTAKGYGNTKNAAFFFDALLFQGVEELETLEIKIPKFLINDFDVELPIISLKLSSEDLWVSVP